MLLTVAVVLGIIFGYIRKGRLRGFSEGIRMRALFLVFIAAAIEFALPFIMARVDYPPLMLIGRSVIYALLLAFCALGARKWEFVVLGLGIFLNALVILSNNGAMPVTPRVAEVPGLMAQLSEIQQSSYPHYALAHEGTRFAYLGDVIVLRWPIEMFLSIGDIVMMAGVFLLIQRIMLGARKKRKKGKHAL